MPESDDRHQIFLHRAAKVKSATACHVGPFGIGTIFSDKNPDSTPSRTKLICYVSGIVFWVLFAGR